MNGVISSVFFFVVAIGVLITVHEFGHFWVARRLGVKVLKFSIGFGKPLFKWRRKNDATEYVIAAVPLGGYVQMLDEREGPVDEQELHKAFNRKPLASRFAVVAAGPLFNFLLAILCYWVIFVVGVNGIKPIIGEVEPSSIAYTGGMEKGDQIVSINGEETLTWSAVELILLDEGLSKKAVDVAVLDQAGIVKSLILDLGTLTGDVGKENLLGLVGITPYRPSIPPVIDQLLIGGAAEMAGMKSGDKVLSADGVLINDWETWVKYIQERPEQLIQVEIERDGQIKDLQLRPEKVRANDKEIGRIGANVFLPPNLMAALQVEVQYTPGTGLIKAIKKTWDMSFLTLSMLGHMVTGDVSVRNISGPISIAQYAGYTASAGFIAFVSFIALISISLGIINLLPIPVLDGGHLFYYAVEFLKGSPLSEEAQMFGQRLGIIILAVVMILAFYNDLLRVFG